MQLAFNTATNQIASGTCNPPTANQYCYDAAGNMIADGFHTYAYDAEGNATGVDGGSTATYKYDAANRRVRAQTSAGTTEYLIDASGRMSEYLRQGTGVQ